MSGGVAVCPGDFHFAISRKLEGAALQFAFKELEGTRQWGKLKLQNRKGFGVFWLRGRVLEGF